MTVMDNAATYNSADSSNVVEQKKEEKLTSIMEAANALTALGDEDEGATDGGNASIGNNSKVEDGHDDNTTTVRNERHINTALSEQGSNVEDGTTSINSANSGAAATSTESNNAKRYLPEHKKPDAAPTFPEKMMALMRSVDEHRDDPKYCAAWLPDGKSFVVRNPDEFARQVVPKFFKPTKFSSFTRKLYRWGFRQINRGIGPDDPVIFGNEFFERDNEELMSKMRSITAAGTRKVESRIIGSSSHNMYGKRPYDGGGSHNSMYDSFAEQQKRYLYEQFMHQQKNAQMMHPQQHTAPVYGGMTNSDPMHMNHRGGGNAPGMDPGYPPHPHMMPMNNKPYVMQQMDGTSQPMMMNMPYNNSIQQHQHQPQQHSTPQQPPLPQHQLQHHSGMNPSHMGTPIHSGIGTGGSGNMQQQHIGGPPTGSSMSSNGPNMMHQPSPQSVGPPPPHPPSVGGSGQGVYMGGGSSGNGTGNPNTSEIVNAAIRALQYSS